MSSDDIVGVFQHWVAEMPDRLALASLDKAGEPDGRCSYAELDRRCSEIAAHLAARLAPGERVLLLCPSPIEYIAAFLGCLCAGVIAVPVNPLRPRHADRLASIAADAGARVGLTGGAQAQAMQLGAAGAPALRRIEWLDIEALHGSPLERTLQRRVPAGEPAYLQYTSGSTGTPRGVEVTHAALVRNLTDFGATLSANRDSVMLSWLPLFHDMGLVSALLPLFGGFSGYLMDAAAFVQSPVTWLRLIDRFRATLSAAPNFALDLCVARSDAAERAGLDLSRLVSVALGAEPIRAASLQRFAETFEAQGFREEMFRPGYGLAESTLMVSGVPAGAAARRLQLDKKALERGQVLPAAASAQQTASLVSMGIWPSSMALRIVDASAARALGDDRVGEIWVSGASVARGYWGRPEETAAAFRAQLEGEGARSWLRTGDLGFVQQGELYITGRCKDLLIVRGMNHYPQDIEDTARRSSPVLQPQGGVAFAAESAGEERLVIVHEVARAAVRGVDVESVVRAIRRAVAADHGLTVAAVALIRPGGLPRTTSGKVQRALCRQRFEAGDLPLVGTWTLPPPSPAAATAQAPAPRGAPPTTMAGLRGWLIDEVARQLRLERAAIDAREPLASYGMDSVCALRLAASIADLVGRPLPATLLYDVATIDGLCSHLLDAPGGEPRKSLPRSARDEPVAVVGMACRFPGAPDLEGFAQLLVRGLDGVGVRAAQRARLEGIAGDAAPAASRRAGRIDDVDAFDALFFGISPREAENMDPQQRMLLETAWTALEHADIVPATLAGREVGVFVGASSVDYLRLSAAGIDRLGPHAGTGNALSILANRLSYALDLRGPSLAIDTACSSSLVALHQACAALRGGESELALAAGVNLILCDDLTAVFEQAGMLAADGRCKTFDAAADGYVRGEGCGVVVLKPLSSALADGDRVLALIRGTAVNQDGRSNGLTAPNGAAQQAVMQQALTNAGIDAASVGFVETHGTGTALGDPIEVAALRQVYGQADGTEATACFLGALKTQIGHLEAAAGIAGLIKTVLVLDSGAIPGNLHFSSLNPHIDLSGTRLRVAASAAAWPASDGPRRAAVSSFGFGGTNAHAILEQAAPAKLEADTPRPGVPAPLLTLSARSEDALRETARLYLRRSTGGPDESSARLCQASNMARTHFEHRCTVQGDDAAGLAAGLGDFVAGIPSSRVLHDPSQRRVQRIAFLFTGQGSQYPGMGRALFESQPVFARALRECATMALDIGRIDLLRVLYEPERATASIHDTQAAQPALFSLAYALAKMWASWGIEPAAVLGHSAGAIAAACVAGVLDAEDGLRLALERGRLMQELPAGGAMAAVTAPEATVRAAMSGAGHALDMAAFNGPQRFVVSGRANEIDALCDTLLRQGHVAKRLSVSHAFHSALVEPALQALGAFARTLAHRRPHLPFVSDLTGMQADDALFGPDYWPRHARAPIQFHAGMQSLHELGCEAYLEVGPRPVLVALGRRCVPREQTLWLSSLDEAGAAREHVTQALARLHCAGATIDWVGVHGPRARPRPALPTYPFERQRHWKSVDRTARAATQAAAASGGGMQGVRLDTASAAEAIYQYHLARDEPAWLAAHRVQGRIRVPAALLLLLVLDAAGRHLCSDGVRIVGFRISAPLDLPDEPPPGQPDARRVVLQVLVQRDAAPGGARFELCSRLDDEGSGERPWTTVCRGTIARATDDHIPPFELLALRAGCPDAIDPSALYDGLAALGIAYGPAFRALRDSVRNEGEALAQVALDVATRASAPQRALHPVLLDACFQALAALVPPGLSGRLYLPVSMESFEVRGAQAGTVQCHARLLAADAQHLRGDVTLLDAEGQVLATARGLGCVAIETGPDAAQRSFWEGVWRAQPPASSDEAPLPREEPTAQALEAAMRGCLDESRTAHRLATWLAVAPALESLSVQFASAVLAHLHGGALEPGMRFSAQALATRGGVVPQQQALFERLLQIGVEEGTLAREADGEYRVEAAAAGDTAGVLDGLSRLRARFADCEAEIELLARFGPVLQGVLSGRVEPMQLLFPDADASLAYRLYHDAPAARVMNTIVAAAIAQVPRPTGRALRVLEIGAGTGGTAAALLEGLGGALDYVFTDVSPLFVARARQRWATDARCSARVLDIERGPAAQGVPLRRQDIVIASNVLHATSDLRAALEHARELLRPGGLLLLAEGTRRQRFLDLVFGATEGWWRFADRGLRADHPLLDVAQWQALLRDCGFDSVSTLTPGADAAHAGAGHSVIAARRSRDDTPHWLVLGAPRSAEALAERIRRGAGRCTLAPQAAPGDLDRLLREAGPLTGVVQLTAGVDDVAAAGPADTVPEAFERACRSTLALVQALQRLDAAPPPRLWLVTRAAQVGSRRDAVPGLADAGVPALGRTVALEHPDWRCTCIDLDAAPGGDEADRLFDELTNDGDEPRIALRGGERLVFRLAALPVTGAPAARDDCCELVSDGSGRIDSLKWRPGTRRAPQPHEIEIKVAATGLNFRDLLAALGHTAAGAPGAALGCECAGVVVRCGSEVHTLSIGDRVAALADGAFAAYVTVPALLAVRIPTSLRLDDAAAIPSNFATASHAMEDVAPLQAGDTVLVHAAAGGTGGAAIQVAHGLGAHVVATASPWKWPHLRALGIEHVSSSRSADFLAQVAEATLGQGVHAVLNSLADEFVTQGFDALRPNGCFIELGKKQVLEPATAARLRNDVAYRRIDLVTLSRDDPAQVQAILQRVAQRFERGTYSLPPCRYFGVDEVHQAFREMQSAEHIGKIVFRHRPSQARPSFEADGAYLVTGGGGDLGRLAGRWLVERGAGCVVLLGRSPPTPESSADIESMRLAGACVVYEVADVCERAQLARVIESIERDGWRLRAVLHAAGVLEDATLATQGTEALARVLRPKVAGAWNLHVLTQERRLDDFVLFSSMAGLLGSPGQGSHVAANAFLDGLAQARRSRGLPGLSIQWGAWTQLGAAARASRERHHEFAAAGQLTPAFGLQALDRVWDHRGAAVGVAPLDATALRAGPARRYLERLIGAAGEQPSAVPAGTLAEALQHATPAERKPRLASAIAGHLAQVLGLNAAQPVLARRGFFELGMDSLTSMELRNTLQQQLGLSLPSTLLFDHPTIEDLVEHLSGLLGWHECADAPEFPAQDAGGALTDAEVAAALDHELSSLRALP